MYEQKHLALALDGFFLRIPNWVLREMGVLQHEVSLQRRAAPRRRPLHGGRAPARRRPAPSARRPRLRPGGDGLRPRRPARPALALARQRGAAPLPRRRGLPGPGRAPPQVEEGRPARSTRATGSPPTRSGCRSSSRRWRGARSPSTPSTPPASSCGPSGRRPGAPSATSTSAWRPPPPSRPGCAAPCCAGPPTRPTRTSSAAPSGCCSPTRSRRGPWSRCAASSTGMGAIALRDEDLADLGERGLTDAQVQVLLGLPRLRPGQRAAPRPLRPPDPHRRHAAPHRHRHRPPRATSPGCGCRWRASPSTRTPPSPPAPARSSTGCGAASPTGSAPTSGSPSTRSPATSTAGTTCWSSRPRWRRRPARMLLQAVADSTLVRASCLPARARRAPLAGRHPARRGHGEPAGAPARQGGLPALHPHPLARDLRHGHQRGRGPLLRRAPRRGQLAAGGRGAAAAGGAVRRLLRRVGHLHRGVHPRRRRGAPGGAPAPPGRGQAARAALALRGLDRAGVPRPLLGPHRPPPGAAPPLPGRLHRPVPRLPDRRPAGLHRRPLALHHPRRACSTASRRASSTGWQGRSPSCAARRATSRCCWRWWRRSARSGPSRCWRRPPAASGPSPSPPSSTGCAPRGRRRSGSSSPSAASSAGWRSTRRPPRRPRSKHLGELWGTYRLGELEAHVARHPHPLLPPHRLRPGPPGAGGGPRPAHAAGPGRCRPAALDLAEQVAAIRTAVKATEAEDFLLARMTYRYLGPDEEVALISMPHRRPRHRRGGGGPPRRATGGRYAVRGPVSPREVARLLQLFARVQPAGGLRHRARVPAGARRAGSRSSPASSTGRSAAGRIHMEKLVVGRKHRSKGMADGLMREFFRRLQARGVCRRWRPATSSPSTSSASASAPTRAPAAWSGTSTPRRTFKW